MKVLKLFLATSFFVVALHVTYAQSASTSQASKPSANKELIKKVFDELINKKNLAVMDQYFAEDVVDHAAFPEQAPGREGIKASIKGLYDLFPDLRVEIQEIISERDIVVTRDFWTGTDKNSGTKKSGWVIHMFKLKNGLITDAWSKGWEWMN